MRWMEYLTDTAKEVCDSKEHLFHYCCIMQTIGKYIYIHASRSCDISREVKPVVKEQSDSGLLLVASGCLGQMCKLYKKNRCKYGSLLKPLSTMLINKKSKIPVLFASRDKGGLYVIKPEYLPALRLLDRCLREEFANTSEMLSRLAE